MSHRCHLCGGPLGPLVSCAWVQSPGQQPCACLLCIECGERVEATADEQRGALFAQIEANVRRDLGVAAS